MPTTPRTADRRVARAIFSVLVALLAATGCASLNVQTSYDPTASFGEHRAFRFRADPGEARNLAGIDNPAVVREIEREIRRALLERGYEESDDAGLEIGFHAAVTDRVDSETWTTYYGYRWRGVWVEETEVRAYDEGTLAIDIIDAEQDLLLWRGTASAEVSGLRDAQRRQDVIREAVREILERFPPGR